MIYTDGKQFLLEGKNYSYAMFVNGDGFLQQLHYGGKMEKEDIGFLADTYLSTMPNHWINKDEAFDSLPSEYGFYAKGDYKEPTAIFERQDGASMSRLRYDSYRVEKDAPKIVGMPHVRSGDETLVITLKDDFSDIEVDLYYTVCDSSDVLVRNAIIRNVGKEPVMLKRAFSFHVELANGEYQLLRLAGRWGQERIPEIAPVAHGLTRIHSLRGSSSHQTNPFMGILRKDCGEESGECYGVQLVYSGSFALTAEWSKYGALTLQGGINETGFCWELRGGESFVTPQVLLTYSNAGMGGMSREIHDFLRERIINPAYAFKRRPVVINNWEATYFDFDNEKLCAIITEAAKLGIDTFVLDDGWFGKRTNDFAGLGDWFVNEEKLKGGLKKVSACCKEHGMKFGLWFEPEMVNEDSELFRAHPDWALCKEGVEPMRSRQQLVLDFTRKEVVDYIFGAVSKIIKENDISYIKWDMNRYVSECYSASLPYHRQGEVMHRYILGVYDLAQRLLDEFPDLFIEGCAGGGNWANGTLTDDSTDDKIAFTAAFPVSKEVVVNTGTSFGGSVNYTLYFNLKMTGTNGWENRFGIRLTEGTGESVVGFYFFQQDQGAIKVGALRGKIDFNTNGGEAASTLNASMFVNGLEMKAVREQNKVTLYAKIGGKWEKVSAEVTLSGGYGALGFSASQGTFEYTDVALDIKPAEDQTFSLTLKDGEGNALSEGTTVLLTNPRGETVSKTTDAQGNVTLESPYFGDFIVEVNGTMFVVNFSADSLTVSKSISTAWTYTGKEGEVTEHKIADQGNVVISHDETSVTVAATWDNNDWKRDEVYVNVGDVLGDSTNYIVRFKITATLAGNWTERFGIRVVSKENDNNANAGFLIWDKGGDGICFGNLANYPDFGGGGPSDKTVLTEAMFAAGVDIQIIRNGNSATMYAKIDGKWQSVYTVSLADGSTAQLGFSAAGGTYVYSDMSIVTVSDTVSE